MSEAGSRRVVRATPVSESTVRRGLSELDRGHTRCVSALYAQCSGPRSATQVDGGIRRIPAEALNAYVASRTVPARNKHLNAAKRPQTT